MRAVVFQHEELEGPGVIGKALEAEGFQLVRRYRQVKHDDLSAELIVVMGGSMGVYEGIAHPFLNDEVAFLSERLAADKPVLGICLGAQLIAAAAGAEVFPGKNGLEVGVGPVRWTKDGLADPVIAGVRPKTVVAHWHGDTFKAVPGATLLASTDRYTQQGFRLGNSYGFQFHPELTAAELEKWLTEGADELREKGKDPETLKAELPKLKAAEPELKDLAERLAHHFAGCVR